MRRLSILLAFIASSIMGVSLAHASEPQMIQGALCETLEQAEAFLRAYDGTNHQDALKASNGDLSTQDACGIVRVVAVRVQDFHEVKTPLGEWVMVKVMVVGVPSAVGVRKLRTPVPQYTAFPLGPPVKRTSV